MFAILNSLAGSLQPFRALDPGGWFAWRLLLGPHLALFIAAVGMGSLVFGSREGVFRFVAVPLALLIGIATTPSVLALTHATAVPDRAVELVLPLGLALLSGFVPHTVAFLALGILGAKVGASLVDEHELLIGALPGFVSAGAVGVVFSSFANPFAASALGALLFTGGIWRAFAGPVGKLLGGGAWTPAIVALGLAALGTAAQLALWNDPEARKEKRARAREKKQRAKDERAREARFSEYGKRGG